MINTRSAVLVLALTAGCSAPSSSPTPENDQAMALYAKTMGDTMDSAYTDPRWDGVAAMLRDVPSTNPDEHRKAGALLKQIEAGRATQKGRDAIAAQTATMTAAPRAPSASPAQPKSPQQTTDFYLQALAAP